METDEKNDLDDDISTTTTHNNNRTIEPTGEEKEYVVRFVFTPKKENHSDVAKTHFALLKNIQEIYTTIRIFDNNGDVILDFNKMKSYDAYLRHFKLKHSKSNPKKNRQQMYLCFHRIISDVPISQIKRNATVFELLNKVNARMTTHMWSEDETDIAVLGFMVKIDPSNHLKEEFESAVRSKIHIKTGRSYKNIPRFQCGYTTPYVRHDDGTSDRTKSYDIQCRRKDAKDLIAILQETYKKDPTFMFHRARHTNLQIYINAVRRQNNYLSKTRIVPIKGIHEEIMFYLTHELEGIQGVEKILKHKQTNTEGRWSIVTDDHNFRTVTDTIATNIASWNNFYLQENQDIMLPKDYPTPDLAFRNQPNDDDSGTSFLSYMSACNSIYTVEDTTFNAPPDSEGPTTQSWGTPGSGVPLTIANTPSTAVSSIGQQSQEVTRLTQANAKQARELTELREQLQSLAQQVRQSKENPPIQHSVHSQDTSSQYKDSIIQDVLTAIRQEFAQTQNAQALFNLGVPVSPQQQTNDSFDTFNTVDSNLTQNPK